MTALKPRKRRTKKRWIIAAGLALYMLCEYTIPRFPFGPYKLYGNMTAEQKASVISYESLTDEQSYPFQQSYPFDYSKSLDAKRDHSAAIRKFPNVQSCLIKSEKKKAVPDLRLIDWDEIGTVRHADVCTWRIFSSLGTPERAKEWLGFHGAINVNPPQNITAGKWERGMGGILFPTRGLRLAHKRILNPGMFVRAEWSDHDSSLQNVFWRWQDPL